MTEWRSIIDYPGYEVSDDGRVRSIERTVVDRRSLRHFQSVMLKPRLKRGYPVVVIRDAGATKNASVHRLVATAFLPNPENKPQVNHKNGIPTDNRVSNLEWCTAAENTQHSYSTGLQQPKRGVHNHQSKLTDAHVAAIRADTRSQRKIAADYGVTQSVVSDIKRGKLWAHI